MVFRIVVAAPPRDQHGVFCLLETRKQIVSYGPTGDCLEVDVLLFTAVVFAGSIGAGLLGSLTGLGGGVVIVPLLTVVLGVDIHYAIGASLVSVIATSSGAAAAYVQGGLHQHARGHVPGGRHHARRAGGALLATSSAPRHRRSSSASCCSSPLILASRARTGARPRSGLTLSRAAAPGRRLPHAARAPWTITCRGVPLGFALMLVAGGLSGLLGIGSGAMKVLAMDQAMRMPFKVSTTTSNFMIGVTAAASAGIYLPAATSIPAWPCRSCWACWPGRWPERACS